LIKLEDSTPEFSYIFYDFFFIMWLASLVGAAADEVLSNFYLKLTEAYCKITKVIY
jgi:hypothetical protein